jgi:hypothetical protein
VEVVWRLDDEEDVRHVERTQYRSQGGVKIPLGRGPCEVEVRSVIGVGKETFTSPPVSATITHVVETAIRYDVRNLVPTLRGRMKKVVFTADQDCADIRVQIIASPGRALPVRPSDGEIVLDTTLALRHGVPNEQKVIVPRKSSWVRCFVITGHARLVDPPIVSLKEP